MKFLYYDSAKIYITRSFHYNHLYSSYSRMSVSFSTTYAQFVDDLIGTFPEFTETLTTAKTGNEGFYARVWKSHTKDVADQNEAIFGEDGIEVVPGFFMKASLWKELSKPTKAAIWKYLSSLLLLSAVSDSSESFWDLSGFNADMEEMMRKLREGGVADAADSDMGDLFEKFSKMAGAFGFKDASGAEPNFKIPERLFKGHIAKIAEELVKEFKPEDFGISPEMLETKDPARIFQFLQEIFSQKPELLMGAAQKIAKKIQAKFQRGEINRDDIIREAEELMKEFSDNEAFSNLFGSLGEMFKNGEKESGNEGSARRREVQERLRRKAAEKKAVATTNTIVSSAAEATALAAAAALMREEDEEEAKAKAKGAKGGAKKAARK